MTMMLVNGLPSDCIHVEDRGLSYGDGVFRTLRLQQGKPSNWQRHHAKLRYDCGVLDLDCPDSDILLREISQLSKNQDDLTVKIVITRGHGLRGYAAPALRRHSRIVSCVQPSNQPSKYSISGIQAGLCRIKLGHQPALAGIKHLNRLENVLAASECQKAGLPEGLLEDEQGVLIGGTRSNLFLVSNGNLFTPDLTQCGVAGVQRQRVLDWADRHGIEYRIEPLQMKDLMASDEAFLVNSVFGLWPIREFPGYCRTEYPMAGQIRQWLDQDET